MRVQVLDAPDLDASDPMAFRSEAMLAFIVFLKVVDVVTGKFEGDRLGVYVHSPSMFAGDAWGFRASPQRDPAELWLRWKPKYCMFELTRIVAAKAPATGDDALHFTAPSVHAAIAE